MPAPPCDVVDLASASGVLARVEDWFVAAWPDWYGPGGQGSALRDLGDCLSGSGSLPRCLVALNGAGEPVGTVSLRTKSPGSDRYPGAWLTALLVPEAFRRAGVGTRLVEAAEEEAARLGFSEIFATTGTAVRLLTGRGWQRIDTAATPEGNLDIFRKPLTSA